MNLSTRLRKGRLHCPYPECSLRSARRQKLPEPIFIFSYFLNLWRVPRIRAKRGANGRFFRFLRGSIPGEACRPLSLGPLGRSPTGNQPGVLDFINQSPVTDLQRLRGFPAIPLVRSQSLQDHILFHLADRILREALQRNLYLAVPSRLDHSSGSTCRDFLVNCSLGPKQHITRHAVGQLADVASPSKILQILQHLRRKSVRFHLKLFFKLLPEILGEHGNIVPALTQPRHAQPEYMDSVK